MVKTFTFTKIKNAKKRDNIKFKTLRMKQRNEGNIHMQNWWNSFKVNCHILRRQPPFALNFKVA